MTENQEQGQVLEILNRLLEAEKAGVQTLDDLIKAYPDSDKVERFNGIKEDEAWSCRGLIASIRREGGTMSTATGDFADKVRALDTLDEKITLLNKGQSWVVRKIDEVLTHTLHDETKEFLIEMKRRHIFNLS